MTSYPVLAGGTMYLRSHPKGRSEDPCLEISHHKKHMHIIYPKVSKIILSDLLNDPQSSRPFLI